MKWLAGFLTVVALVAGIWLLGAQTGVEPVPMGDQLGPEPGESIEEYSARASISLREADEPAFAMVAFASPLGAAEAADVLAPVGRVSAVMPPGAAPVVVGEGDRAANFALAVPTDLAGAVVRDSAAVLREVAADERVRVVEVLPPDAVWGAFAIRPLS